VTVKRKDECLFCKSRKCYIRIVRQEAEPFYDEIACDEHGSDLENHSDEVLGSYNGIMRYHITGSSRMKRFEPIN
jgi:hypothetical protein